MPDRVIPSEWLGPAGTDKVVLHWTAGAYVASAVDREHYHCILQWKDGQVSAVKGDYSPADNDYTGDDRYAAHVKGLNSHSYGLSLACMAGAIEGGSHGDYPMRREQWEAAILAAADVCEAYGLQVSDRTVLSHAEVERVFGVDQSGKWDCNELSFARELSPYEVHEDLRRRTREALAGGPPCGVVVNGGLLEQPGFLKDDRAWVPLVVTMGTLSAEWQATWHRGVIRAADGGQEIELMSPEDSFWLPLITLDGVGHVPAADLRRTHLVVTWDAEGQAVWLSE